MTPEQQKYIVENKFEKNKFVLLKSISLISLVLSIIITIMVIIYTSQIAFILLAFVLIVLDLLKQSKSLFVLEKNEIHVVNAYGLKLFNKNDYKVYKFLIVNKRQLRIYFKSSNEITNEIFN